MYANTTTFTSDGENVMSLWGQCVIKIKKKTYKLNPLKKAATNSPAEIRGQTATELMYLITNQNTDYGGGILVDHWSTISSYVLRAGKWQK